MMNDNYLLSVAIPTKNRYQYLLPVINILKQLDANIVEIVINDNSDDNTPILEMIDKLPDNIRYYYTQDKLSQQQNSEKAIEKCRGEYVCYIGDDDCITNKLLSKVQWMKENQIEAMNMCMAGFDWPDMKYSTGRERNSTRIPQWTGNTKRMDTKKELIKALEGGAQIIKYLPRLYHGVVSKQTIELIRDKCGCYFPGPSPDMANAVATALMIDEHYFCDEPLIISGVGYGSAGGKGMRGEHKGSLKNAGQLAPDIEKQWDDLVPKVWIGNAIWFVSARNSLIQLGEYENYKKYLNYYPMYARTFIKFPEYRLMVIKYCNSPVKFIRLFNSLVSESVSALKRKRDGDIKLKNGVSSNDIDSIEGVFELLNEQLSKK